MVPNHCQTHDWYNLYKALNTLTFKRTNTTLLTRRPDQLTYLRPQALIKIQIGENISYSKIPMIDQKQDLPSLNKQYEKLHSWPGCKVSSNGTFINWPCTTLCRENEYSFYHTWKGLSPIAQFFAISPK